ncbi:hypothetical protein Gohar_027242, partial [Gossypium harknessii]|nr:hypothetical protein [Gossypium harknessii]
MAALTNLAETTMAEETSTTTQFDVYKKCGWSEEEILDALRTHPLVMATSEGRIKALMDFFVNAMGFKASFVAKQPYFPGLSMEKRLVSKGKGTVGERERVKVGERERIG